MQNAEWKHTQKVGIIFLKDVHSSPEFLIILKRTMIVIFLKLQIQGAT